MLMKMKFEIKTILLLLFISTISYSQIISENDKKQAIEYFNLG